MQGAILLRALSRKLRLLLSRGAVGNLNQQENAVGAPNCPHHFHANLAWLFIPASLALPRVQPEPLWIHCSFPWSQGFQGSSAQR